MRFAPARVEIERRSDGSAILRSPDPLRPFARCVGDWVEQWASAAPDRLFLAERDERGGWRRLTYGDAAVAVRSVAQGLLELGATPQRPVILLSDNSIDHALVQLAAMEVGVPAAPVSPAYSLVSRDFAKLREIVSTIGPGVVFAEDSEASGPALAAALPEVPRVSSRGPATASVQQLRGLTPGARVEDAHSRVGPETVAKILFTSGSTGRPRGVVNPQRMLCSNQQSILQVWPLLAERPPIVVDWLPWSHTFGGNHNFNMVLANGGTLYIDAGKPAPHLFGKTADNLREISPTLYFNVPRGFERLAEALETDAALRTTFFADLDLLFYAAAALPQSTWERLERVADQARPGRRPAFVSAWGSTETAPLVTSVHFPIDRAGVIGLPAPGIALKLTPTGAGDGKREMKVKGPNVTPGYWERGGGVSPVALDDEGFLPTGDAGRLEDEGAPERGVVFDGRTAENFKLVTGTWVAVGELRVRVIAACSPYVLDAVVSGHDGDYVSLLLFPAPASLPKAELAAVLLQKLGTYNAQNPSSSTRIGRAMVEEELPSIDHGEITDKGYINQRAVLNRRSQRVAALYEDPPSPMVLVVDSTRER